MQVERKHALLAEGALLLCGIIWGSGFVIMKTSLDSLPVNWLLALRFSLAAVVSALLCCKRLVRANRYTVHAGLIGGLFIYAAYYTQTVGLQSTTAGNNAFVTAAYVVLVPLFVWAMTRKYPGLKVILAAVLCLTGVGIIALDANFSLHAGDMWTLACSVLYALHIVCISFYTRKGADVFALTSIQFVVMAACALFGALLFEPAPTLATVLSAQVLPSLLYLGLASTVLALYLQNIGLRYAPAAGASLLMSTEAPFGCLFGIWFLHEPFTLRFALGALCIVGAILMSELMRKPAPVLHEG